MTNEERSLNKLVSENMHLCGVTAARFHKTNPLLEYDELLGAAHEAMARAAMCWDPEKGARFKSWVLRCIINSLQNYKAERAKWAKRKMDAGIYEIPMCNWYEEGNVHRAGFLDTVPDPEAYIEEDYTQEDGWEFILKALTSRQREIIELRFRGDKPRPTTYALGKRWRMSHQAVSQHEHNAIAKLKEAAENGLWPSWVYAIFEGKVPLINGE